MASKILGVFSKNWHPLVPNEKRLIIRTTFHNEKEALMTGTIVDGYGAGKLEEWDSGECIIEHYDPENKIKILFKGKKIQGEYYMIKTKDKSYLFFKKK
jgi:hypothetical protein